MKWIKKIGVGLLTLILINLICLLAISFNLKKILINGIIKETITQQITKKDQQEGNFIITEDILNEITDDEQIRDLLNSPEVEELINKYLDITIYSMIDENYLDEIELEKDMLQFLQENKESLEKKIGHEITDEVISNTKQQVEDRDWSRSYKQTIQNASKSITSTEKTVLKGYKFLISKELRMIIIILIIIDIGLIALIEKSLFKWLKQLGRAMTVSGILLLVMCISVKIIIMKTMNFTSFHMESLQKTGIGMLISGIILIILLSIINKRIDKKKEEEKEYAISETLNE